MLSEKWLSVDKCFFVWRKWSYMSFGSKSHRVEWTRQLDLNMVLRMNGNLWCLWFFVLSQNTKVYREKKKWVITHYMGTLL